jgi:hypothetical protein
MNKVVGMRVWRGGTGSRWRPSAVGRGVSARAGRSLYVYSSVDVLGSNPVSDCYKLLVFPNVHWWESWKPPKLFLARALAEFSSWQRCDEHPRLLLFSLVKTFGDMFELVKMEIFKEEKSASLYQNSTSNH